MNSIMDVVEKLGLKITKENVKMFKCEELDEIYIYPSSDSFYDFKNFVSGGVTEFLKLLKEVKYEKEF